MPWTILRGWRALTWSHRAHCGFENNCIQAPFSSRKAVSGSPSIAREGILRISTFAFAGLKAAFVSISS